LKEKVSEEMDKKGLCTKIPENVYDPQRDQSERTLRTIYDFSDAADDEGEGYSFDLCKW
jgi:hypothetical protein